MVITWTDERVDGLKRMHAEGHSFREIGAAIGVSRNAAIGKAKRMGLVVRPMSGPKPKKPKAPKAAPKAVRTNRPAVRSETIASLQQYKLRCVEIVPLNLQLSELEPDSCRYPDGGWDGDDKPETPITFCGHPRVGSSSYCMPHFALTCQTEGPARATATLREVA